MLSEPFAYLSGFRSHRFLTSAREFTRAAQAVHFTLVNFLVDVRMHGEKPISER